MIGMTENDPTVGWESIHPTVKPFNRIKALSVSAWKLASLFVDQGRSLEEIQRMQDTAQELDDLSNEECTCTPNHECNLCNAIARVMNDDDYGN